MSSVGATGVVCRRTSDGIRDTGYTADKGGQVRGNIVFRPDDDRTAFFQNLPFQVPGFSTSGTPASPIKVDMGAVWPIGLNFKRGTVTSPYNRVSTMLDEYGQRRIDTADGSVGLKVLASSGNVVASHAPNSCNQAAYGSDAKLDGQVGAPRAAPPGQPGRRSNAGRPSGM